MSSAVSLGIRFALRATGSGRRRSAMVTAAATVGTAVALTILAFARADRSLHPERYADGGMNVVIGSVMAVVGLQIGALTATVGRLSAAVRTRRLSNLRMLGLTAGRTRIVVAVEVGVAAAAGAAAGVAVFLACRPVLGRLHTGGVRWTSELLHPGPLAMGAVPVVTVVLTIALAALPDRFDPRTSASRVRGGPSSAPSKWRLIPLVVGIVACYRSGSGLRWSFRSSCTSLPAASPAWPADPRC